MKLILTPYGSAELVDDDDITVWASDTDQDFLEEFAGRNFLKEDDVDDIIDYLEDVEMLTEEEAEDLDVEEHSLEDDAANDDDGPVSPFDAYR